MTTKSSVKKSPVKIINQEYNIKSNKNVKKVQKSGYVTIPKSQRTEHDIKHGDKYTILDSNYISITYKRLKGECVLTKTSVLVDEKTNLTETSIGLIDSTIFKKLQQAQTSLKDKLKKSSAVKLKKILEKLPKKLPKTVKITKSGGIIIPRTLRTELNIDRDYYFVNTSDDEIILTRQSKSCSCCGTLGNSKNTIYEISDNIFICIECLSNIKKI